MNRIAFSVLRQVFFLFVLVSDLGFEGSLTSVRTLLVGLIGLSVLPFFYLYNKDFINTALRPPILYFCIFIFLGIVSTFFSEIPIKSFVYIFGYSTLTIFAITLVNVFRLEMLLSILKFAISLGIFISVVAHFLGIRDGYTYELGWGTTRFGGLYGQPNPMGAASAMYIIIFISSFPKNILALPLLKSKSVITALYSFYACIYFKITFFMSLWTLWQSYSRSSLLGLTVSITTLLFMEAVKEINKWGKIGRIWLVALILLLSLLSIFIIQGISQENVQGLSRSGDEAELTTLTGRTVFWSYLLEKVAEKPLLGYGMGSVAAVAVEFGYEQWATHAHNVYIEAAVYTGYLGALTFVLFMISILFKTAFFFLKGDDCLKPIFALVVFYSIVSFLEPVILGSARNSLLIMLITSAYLSLSQGRREGKIPSPP